MLDSEAILKSFDEKLFPTLALSLSVSTPILLIAFIKSDFISLTLVLSVLYALYAVATWLKPLSIKAFSTKTWISSTVTSVLPDISI